MGGSRLSTMSSSSLLLGLLPPARSPPSCEVSPLLRGLLPAARPPPLLRDRLPCCETASPAARPPPLLRDRLPCCEAFSLLRGPLPPCSRFGIRRLGKIIVIQSPRSLLGWERMTCYYIVPTLPVEGLMSVFGNLKSFERGREFQSPCDMDSLGMSLEDNGL
jgi:hypothetical protein